MNKAGKLIRAKHWRTPVLLAILAAASAFPVAAQPVRLNEIMASNGTSVPEMVDFGDYPDWIELSNTGPASVDLSGYSLTDDPQFAGRWQFPDGTSIASGAFLLIWADGQDAAPGTAGTRPWWPGDTAFTTEWHHASFRLSRAGEGLWLHDAEGLAADSLIYGPQAVDVSLARLPDGEGAWVSTAEPTPGGSNTTPALTSLVPLAAVTVSPGPGRFDAAVQVSLARSGTSGSIHYTLDGSRPTRSSPVYVAPLDLGKTSTVRARAIEDGRLLGAVTTASYLIDPPQELPILALSADPALLWDQRLGIYLNSYKDREIPVAVEFFPNAERAFVIDAGARIGGENIFRFAQKPLNLYFRAEYGESQLGHRIFEHLPVPSWKRLFLRNGGDDWPGTMFRDGLQASILAGQMRNATQAYRPAVLLLNGEYWGIYNIREKLDEQYFLVHNAVDPADLDHLESDTYVIAGDSTDFVNLRAFTAENDLASAENYGYVAEQVDLDNLIDFVVAHSFSANPSWSHNREMWRNRNGDARWRWVLVDMDRGFNINRLGDDRLSQIYEQFELFNRLTANQDFRARVLRRYAVHLNTTFRSSRVLGIIDSLARAIESEIPRHAARWGPYIDSLSIPRWGIEPGIESAEKWAASVEALRSFATERPAIARRHVMNRFGVSGTTALTLQVEPAGAGSIKAEGLILPQGEAGEWFDDVPLALEADSAVGFAFNHWLERSAGEQVTFFPFGSSWHYLDGGAIPSADWSSPEFDDSAWGVGPAELGYGDGDEATVVSWGTDGQNKAITTYFRTSFQVADASAISSLTARIVRDDGAAIYLNGLRVADSNIPAGTLTPDTPASSVVGGAEESAVQGLTIDPRHLVSGVNVLAVEVHQVSPQSSDISFDLSLTGTVTGTAVVETELGGGPALTYTPDHDAVLVAVFEEFAVNRVPTEITTDMTLDRGRSPWVVDGGVQVRSGATLTVDPGVTLRLTAGASVAVEGTLIARGSAASPILLEPYHPSHAWEGLCFLAAGASVMEHFHLEGASGSPSGDCRAAISVLGGSVRIADASIGEVPRPVYSRDAELNIDGVHFLGSTEIGDYVEADGGIINIRNSVFEGNALPDMDAIDLGGVQPGSVVADNEIRGFTGSNSDGVDLGGSSRAVEISGNHIHDLGDKGISIGQGSSALVERNLIARTLDGIGIKDSLSFADIRHNTFLDNGQGVAVYEKNPGRGGASARIWGSLFSGSITASVSADHLSSMDVTYSLAEDELPAGEGNLRGSAWLVDPAALNAHLQAGSPAIDTGDPAAPLDADGSRADMGAFPYGGFVDGPVVINEINYNSAADFVSGDWVELANRSDHDVELEGWVLVDGNRTPSTTFDQGSVLPAGGLLVVARDRQAFLARFPAAPSPAAALANGLGGGGDALYLHDAAGALSDSVAFGATEPWPPEPAGGGSSLELTSTGLDNAQASNWAASSDHGTPGAGNSVSTGVSEASGELPRDFELGVPYPNPFNEAAMIAYHVPHLARVRIEVFDVLGRRVQLLFDAPVEAGSQRLAWNAAGLSSGMYLVTMLIAGPEGHVLRLARTAVLSR